MIPHEVATLADALVEAFQIDWDEAVEKAWAVKRSLESSGFNLIDRSELSRAAS